MELKNYRGNKKASSAPCSSELRAPVTVSSSKQLLELLESLELPRGLRYLDPMANDGLLVHLLRTLNIEPVTSDSNRSTWSIKASPLNEELYKLVKPDVIICCVEKTDLATRQQLVRCAAAVGAALVLLALLPVGEDQTRCDWKLLLHQPKRILSLGRFTAAVHGGLFRQY